MKTRQIIPALALLLTLSTTATAITPRHRHQPQTTQTSTTVQQDAQGQNDAIEAYSDTTAVDTTASAVSNYDATPHNNYDYDYDEDDDFRSVFAETFGSGFLGGLTIFLLFLTIIACIIAPVVIVALILRYLIKRHNQRMQMMEKEMEAEQAYEEQAHKEGRYYNHAPNTSYRTKNMSYSPEVLMQRAITKIAAGIGLALMFYFFDWGFAVGIGLLIACIGGGQYYSAWRTARHQEQAPIDDADFEETFPHDDPDTTGQPVPEEKHDENK